MDVQAPAQLRHQLPETLTEEVFDCLGPINFNEMIGLVLSH